MLTDKALYTGVFQVVVSAAVDNGINMILTPIFTPALDTMVGGERPTNQLLGCTQENGKWSFDFTLVHRWIEMCKRCGVEYYEISHLFTQWGAEHAPKVMATVDGEYKKVFGWETDAAQGDYTAFLKEMIPQLIEVLKEHGVDKNTVFHISDEPGDWMLESYKRAKSTVEDVLDGQIIIDALSDYSFYEKGILEHPVVSTDHVQKYIDNNVKDLWVYYCCGPEKVFPNSFIAMPSARVQVLGYMLYKYDIKGFLHWGFNFYNSALSYYPINPYSTTSADGNLPSGDPFIVYPAPDGAYPSIRGKVTYEAICDLNLCRTLEKRIGREAVVKMIDEIAGFDVRFDEYPLDGAYLPTLRESIVAKLRDTL